MSERLFQRNKFNTTLFEKENISIAENELTKSHVKFANQYMIGFNPLTNCKCFDLLTRSWTKYTTKLAGTKASAKMTKIATNKFTTPWRLKQQQRHTCITDECSQGQSNNCIEVFLSMKYRKKQWNYYYHFPLTIIFLCTEFSKITCTFVLNLNFIECELTWEYLQLGLD